MYTCLRLFIPCCANPNNGVPNPKQVVQAQGGAALILESASPLPYVRYEEKKIHEKQPFIYQIVFEAYCNCWGSTKLTFLREYGN